MRELRSDLDSFWYWQGTLKTKTYEVWVFMFIFERPENWYAIEYFLYLTINITFTNFVSYRNL